MPCPDCNLPSTNLRPDGSCPFCRPRRGIYRIKPAMPKPPLASIFEGAVEYLQGEGDWSPHRWTFSCNAINAYAMDHCPPEIRGALTPLLAKIAPQLFEGFAGSAFDEFPCGPERQYARALWLSFLAHLAETGDLTWEGLQ